MADGRTPACRATCPMESPIKSLAPADIVSVRCRRGLRTRQESRYKVGALQGADEVALADLEADMAQDRVGGRAVEIEIRHGEVQQIGFALECHRVAAELERDLASFAAVDLIALELRDVSQCPVDACPAVGE